MALLQNVYGYDLELQDKESSPSILVKLNLTDKFDNDGNPASTVT